MYCSGIHHQILRPELAIDDIKYLNYCNALSQLHDTFDAIDQEYISDHLFLHLRNDGSFIAKLVTF